MNLFREKKDLATQKSGGLGTKEEVLNQKTQEELARENNGGPNYRILANQPLEKFE